MSDDGEADGETSDEREADLGKAETVTKKTTKKATTKTAKKAGKKKATKKKEEPVESSEKEDEEGSDEDEEPDTKAEAPAAAAVPREVRDELEDDEDDEVAEDEDDGDDLKKMLKYLSDIFHTYSHLDDSDLLEKLQLWLTPVFEPGEEDFKKAARTVQDHKESLVQAIKLLRKQFGRGAKDVHSRFLREASVVGMAKRKSKPVQHLGEEPAVRRQVFQGATTPQPQPRPAPAPVPPPAAPVEAPQAMTATNAQQSVPGSRDCPQVEVFVTSRSRERAKKIHHTYSNCFRLRKGQLPGDLVGENIVYEVYNIVYGFCDRFNRILNDKSWKSLHRRGNYLAAIDDFYFTMLLVDAWVFNITQTESTISFQAFTENLAHALFKVVNH